MFGPIFIEAIRAPLKDPEWVRKCLVGGLLLLMPMLLLLVSVLLGLGPVPFLALLVLGLAPFFVLLGYLYWIFIDALNGVEPTGLPDWREWRPCFFAGFYLFLIAVGYVVIVAVGVMALLSVLGLIPMGEDPGKLSALMVLLMLGSVLLYGFFPIAFARFAAEHRVWAAFDPGAIWADIRGTVTGDYVRACFGFYGLSLMGNLVLGWIPYLGLPLTAVYLFYVMVVFTRVFGRMIGGRGREVKVSDGR